MNISALIRDMLSDSDAMRDILTQLVDSQKLTLSQKVILRRYTQRTEERLRWEYYRSLPKKHWLEMSGRRTQVVNAQAREYGIPLDGPVISLPAVASAMHDFFSRYKQVLKDYVEGDGQQVQSSALEKYREERMRLTRMERLEREGRLIPRDEVHRALGIVSTILRSACEALREAFGDEASQVMIDALDDAQRAIDHAFGPAE